MGYLKTGIYDDDKFIELVQVSITSIESDKHGVVSEWLKNNLSNDAITADMCEGAIIEIMSVTKSVEGGMLERVMGPLLGVHIAGWIVMLAHRLGLVDVEILLTGKPEEKGN